jgi:RimJ/RimL family protein N-acetyltransferase
MVEASDAEWDRVFVHDPHRFIYSIYNEWSEHIGESQVMVDNRGGAELSLLIGRTDLWHRGNGTRTVMALLDQIFDFYGLGRAWVNVPENNTVALGLFKKLGFVHTDTNKLCQRRDGSTLNSMILSMESSSYQPAKPDEIRRDPVPVITVAGLPGSDAESLAAEIAHITGSRLLVDEIQIGRAHV